MGYIVNPPSGGGGTITAVNGWNVDNATPTAPIIKGLLGNPGNETLHLNGSSFNLGSPVLNIPFVNDPQFKTFLNWMGCSFDFRITNTSRSFSIAVPATAGQGNVGLNMVSNPVNPLPLFTIDGGNGIKINLASNVTIEKSALNVLKIGFFNAAPILQQTVPNVPSGNVSHTEFNNLLQVLRNYGLIA